MAFRDFDFRQAFARPWIRQYYFSTSDFDNSSAAPPPLPTPAVPQTSRLLSLPYDILEQIVELALSPLDDVTFHCPHRFSSPLDAHAAKHIHPTCGSGPGWSCLRTPPPLPQVQWFPPLSPQLLPLPQSPLQSPQLPNYSAPASPSCASPPTDAYSIPASPEHATQSSPARPILSISIPTADWNREISSAHTIPLRRPSYSPLGSPSDWEREIQTGPPSPAGSSVFSSPTSPWTPSLPPGSDTPKPNNQLAVLRAHSLLYQPGRRALLKRTFEVEIRGGTVFFSKWKADKAIERLGRLDLSIGQRVQVTMWPGAESYSKGGGTDSNHTLMHAVVEALNEARARNVTFMIMDTLDQDWACLASGDTVAAVDNCTPTKAEDARTAASQARPGCPCVESDAAYLSCSLADLNFVEHLTVGFARLEVATDANGGGIWIVPSLWTMDIVDVRTMRLDWDWLYYYIFSLLDGEQLNDEH